MTDITAPGARAPVADVPHSNRKSKLDSALEHGAAGFCVFPIAPNAKDPPLIHNWPNLATNDRAQIDLWWTEWPDANIGICTNGLLVVDIDPAKGGKEAFTALMGEMDLLGEPLPPTWASRTRSGGAHLFFGLSKGITVANSVEHICTGVDVRGEGGYVVAPGSTIGDKSYEWKGDYTPSRRSMADAPQWLIDRCKKPAEKTASAGIRVVPENDIALARADEYLRRHAPEAIQGGRDDTAYRLAARLYDEGISKESCLERLMSWNETHCHPSLEFHELERIAWSAQTNRSNSVGAKHPDAPGFDVHKIAPRNLPPPPTDRVVADCMATALQRFHPADIPPVPWVVPGLAARRAVSTTTGPGGVSKSTWALQLAIAGATGRSDICGFEMKSRVRVWVWNQEDDLEEIQRRTAAIMTAFNVSWGDLEDAEGRPMLFIDSGVGKDRRLNLALRSGETAAAGLHLRAMIASAKQVEADLVILDPLVSLHQSSENDNNQMRAVFDLIGGIAVEANCGVLVISHTGKPDKASSNGFAGDAYAGRGASAQPDAARAALTLLSMSESDKKHWNLPPADSHLDYVRIDDAKMNLGKKRRQPRWFRHEDVLVAGFTGGTGHVLRPVTLEPKVKIGEPDRLHTIAKAIHDHLGADRPHAVAEILPHLASSEAAALAQKNRARALDEMFGGAGVNDYLTAFGTIRRANAGGNKGTTLLLISAPQRLNEANEVQPNG